MSVPISIGQLSEPDLQSADMLLMSAFGGASRLFDLRLYCQIQPDGWLLARQAEKPVGMVGAVNYGNFAHVGFMAVHPDAQRQGIGMALMQALLAALERQNVPLVTLDASPAGQPLYEKLGFVTHDETLTFHHTGIFPFSERLSHVQTISDRDLDELIEFDRGFFGAERGRVFQIFLDALPERAFLLRDERNHINGYLFAQKNRIGPWVACQPQEAETLFQAALSLPYDAPVLASIPAENPEIVNLLKRYGFEHGRTNRHMARGQGTPPGRREQIYAQGSLAIG